MFELSQSGNRLRKLLALKRCQKIIDLDRWFLERCALLLNCLAAQHGIEFDLEKDEVVGMNNLYVVGPHGAIGEIPEIEGNDGVGITVNGGCQNVPIVWIREFEPANGS